MVFGGMKAKVTNIFNQDKNFCMFCQTNPVDITTFVSTDLDRVDMSNKQVEQFAPPKHHCLSKLVCYKHRWFFYILLFIAACILPIIMGVLAITVGLLSVGVFRAAHGYFLG